jgi:hypothetical protein
VVLLASGFAMWNSLKLNAIVMGLSLAACAGNTGNTGITQAQGGTAGTAGTHSGGAGAQGGGGGSSNTTPVQGNATLTYSVCSYPSMSISGPGGPPTTTSEGDLVTNGSNGMHVICSVSGQGPYTISATIYSADVSLTVDGTAIAGQTSTARMSFFTPASINTRTDPACTINLNGGSLAVSPGYIWAQYSCSSTTDPTNLGSVCGTSGIFVFKGCSQ